MSMAAAVVGLISSMAGVTSDTDLTLKVAVALVLVEQEIAVDSGWTEYERCWNFFRALEHWYEEPLRFPGNMNNHKDGCRWSVQPQMIQPDLH